MGRTITKTFHQPIGEAFFGVSVDDEIDLAGTTAGLYPGMFLSVGICQSCEVDRVKSVHEDGTIRTYGRRTGCVTVQPLANLSGCWLQLDVMPLPPISVGIVCSSANGVLLDRSFPECALGRELEVNGNNMGLIRGASVLPGGRSVISVEYPAIAEGVGVATAGQFVSFKGKRVGNSPFVTLTARLPESGTVRLSLMQGWRSSKDCIEDVISYSKTLCEGAL